MAKIVVSLTREELVVELESWLVNDSISEVLARIVKEYIKKLDNKGLVNFANQLSKEHGWSVDDVEGISSDSGIEYSLENKVKK